MAPYRPPQLSRETVPVQLNVNENPYGPSQACVTDVMEAVSVVASELNRYPDREFVILREALAAYLCRDLRSGQDPITAGQVWAAIGSNQCDKKT